MPGVRASVIASVLVLLAAACGGGSSDPSGENPPTASTFSIADAMRPDGPLRGVVFTGHVERANPQVRPMLGFKSDATEVTAVVDLGDVAEGSKVTVTWYRVEQSQKREKLFAHEIAVSPGGHAYSQAKAPNGLAPGIYDTAATMDGHSTHTPFVVQQAEGEPASADAPVSGDSWSSESAGDLPEGPETSSDICVLDDLTVSVLAPLAEIDAYASWLGPCTTGTLTATVSGPPKTLASSERLAVPVGHVRGRIGVCQLPGGSDLPGTVVHVAATGSASGSTDEALPDFGEGLLAGLEGIPAAGSKVKAGDRIQIWAIAFLMAPALGVKTLYVDDGRDLIESVGNLSGSAEPVPCDPRRLIAELRTEYRVPENPPPVIELCATGVGFDGTESKNCIRYFTSEVWEGTVTGEAVQAACTPASVPVTGELTVQVGSDGKVTGTMTERRPGFTCGGVPAPDSVQTYPITGQKTAEAFELNVGTLPITGSRATMTSQNINSGYGATVTFTIECATC